MPLLQQRLSVPSRLSGCSDRHIEDEDEVEFEHDLRGTRK